MITKLLTLFPDAVLFQDKPTPTLSLAHLYFFSDQAAQEWIGIPRTDLSERELELLKTLYDFYDPFQVTAASKLLSPQEIVWHDFLFLNGRPPLDNPGTYIRMIQFQVNSNEIDITEFESALRGFFTEEALVIWESANTGVVIEKQVHHSASLTEKEFVSLIKTLETDFYFKLSIYYGKQYLFTNQLPEIFQEEKTFFSFAQNILGKGTVFSFERVFPFFVAYHLPQAIKQKINKEFIELYQEDTEMFTTIKAFLENNLNASSTAKKLYIHRNTLQYRIDKFTDKTGIQLKDFYSAFTVFLGCLVYELDDQTDNVPK